MNTLDFTVNQLARLAYRAYGEVTDFKNFQGNPMPEFDNLTDKIKEAWCSSAVAVWNLALNTPKP